jgi:hypothetical protein
MIAASRVVILAQAGIHLDVYRLKLDSGSLALARVRNDDRYRVLRGGEHHHS